MPDAPDIQAYVEAAASSSNRARFVLIVIITASVLVFAGYWNSRQGSWLNSRLRVARAAEKWWGWDPKVKTTLSAEDQGRFDQSRKFAQVRSIGSVEQARILVAQLQSMQTEHVNLVRVPFFGIAFDINDLGLLGGFGFLVLMLWFRFSLARELSNLQLLFDEARGRGQLEACYDLLCMRQVLTVPPVRNQERQGFWGGVIYVLYFLPAVLQSTVFVNDAFTFDWGWYVSRFNTVTLLIASLIFAVLIAMLTVQNVLLSSKIRKQWDKVAEELEIKRPLRSASAEPSSAGALSQHQS